MSGADSIITYIIKTESDEYYCGKTTNLIKRLNEHKLEHYPKWFNSDKRKRFVNIKQFNGDFEKGIKRCGVKFIFTLLESAP